MRSILHHPPPLSILFTHVPPPPPPPPPAGVLQRLLHKQARAKPLALTSSHPVFLILNSPAATTATPAPSGNITVLITTSIAFAFLYWIANFVVPGFIMKDLQSEDADKDQNPNDQTWID